MGYTKSIKSADQNALRGEEAKTLEKFATVPFSQISIVVQGKVSSVTIDVLRQLRAIFFGSEIILSTWDGTNLDDLVFDKVVLSSDPGAFCADEVAGTPNNVNRQLVSVQAGLSTDVRPYVLKTRTDIFFQDAGFLKYFGKYDNIPSFYFCNRLLICNYYTRDPRIFDTCFHPSDWIVFGRAEDIRAYYDDLPLMSQEDGNWFRTHPKTSTIFTNYLCRFTPEQHIFLSFLKKKTALACTCYYDHRQELILQTERAFAECFVVLDYQKQLKIIFSKYHPNRYFEKHTLITHWKWKALYQHYCRKSFSILWLCNRLVGIMYRLMTGCRKRFVQIADFLGVKEHLKRLLSALKAGRPSER